MEDFQSKPEWLEGINLLNDVEGYFIFRVVIIEIQTHNRITIPI